MCLGNSKLRFTTQVRIDAGLQRACGRGEAVPVPETGNGTWICRIYGGLMGSNGIYGELMGF